MEYIREVALLPDGSQYQRECYGVGRLLGEAKVRHKQIGSSFRTSHKHKSETDSLITSKADCL